MPAMRIAPFVLAALFPLAAGAAERAVRHYVLEPQHVLSDAERASLAAEGVVVQRALAEGRYLVRVAAGSSFDESDPIVRSLSPVGAEGKLRGSAYRAAARGLAFARLKVLFHDDVSIDDAIDA